MEKSELISSVNFEEIAEIDAELPVRALFESAEGNLILLRYDQTVMHLALSQENSSGIVVESMELSI